MKTETKTGEKVVIKSEVKTETFYLKNIYNSFTIKDDKWSSTP